MLDTILMSHKFKTSHIWHDGVGNECECAVIVEYDRYKGFAGDRIDPPEPAHVEFIGMTPVDPSYDIPAASIDHDAIVEECMQHWTDDEIAGQESRAEQRAEMLREERGR